MAPALSQFPDYVTAVTADGVDHTRYHRPADSSKKVIARYAKPPSRGYGRGKAPLSHTDAKRTPIVIGKVGAASGAAHPTGPVSPLR